MLSDHEMMRAIQNNIDRDGQHLFAIFPDDENPGFAYTIGNANLGLPELLIVGNFMPRIMGPILNELGRRMRAARAPLEGDVSLGGRYPVRIRLTGPAAKWRYTLLANRYLGHERYTVLQVLLCDLDGRYPGEPACDPVYDAPLV
ncbi:DUF4262 domain-containing protein [Sphingobium sp. AS12]|uniref:DUF4262 domain-containing protein n=1 Tax=Sphingobium sp. AS12 TaxID=2849495 RepID=UPI001C3136BF|nr:DUF4262 domain-containing protein [Sphingobium sp. AS12]MBV2149936.1 DUF4262 domain-containing protein [Sphingobium sp. AS12]